jgi:outer membrane receptor protein involved in Fe transport
MKDGYTVYVTSTDNSVVSGYRNGNVWYDADGLEISDPEAVLGKSGNGVLPYLNEDEGGEDLTQEKTIQRVFKDYDPQWNFMPRISFSFPISDEALFFAHYDVLTQRPASRVLQMDPTDYLFLNVRSSPTINNPNLKPEKTIDYELGFQQKLTNSSSLVLSTYYREVRDQIQIYRYTGAYPKTYYSYNNIDFGTIKGLTLTYDLRRTQNARVRASYSLQFANGTGSNENTARSLVTSGQPNLRTLLPLNDDRRHSINILLDYRWDEGAQYNGPVIKHTVKGTDKVKTYQLLKNTGVNFTINGGSGTPYTKSSKIYPLGGSRVIEGSINGSRLPWSFRIDARLDRDIMLNWGKSGAYMNIYLQVLNIFDTKNILAVYEATGNADDDGYLAAAEYQTQINQQLDSESYRLLYKYALLNPSNYSAPRQIRLGLSLNF